MIIYLAAGQRLGLRQTYDPAKATGKTHSFGDVFGVCLVASIDEGGFAVRPTNFVCFLCHLDNTISLKLK